jgi:1-acyl-sn-glycerol-3-phosphate acyltransferase
MFRLNVHRQVPLPPGPKLIVANHPSCTDPFLLSVLSPEPISILIVDKAFSIPVAGAYLRWLGNIPVVHDNGRVALEKAQRLLEEGRSVALFPEGWISPQEGGFNPPHTGAARLALLTGVPVVPVGIYLPRERSHVVTSNITGAQSTGYWYLRGPFNMTVGQPMRFKGDVEDRSRVDAISRAIMQQIISLAYESERRTTGRVAYGPPAQVVCEVNRDRFTR